MIGISFLRILRNALRNFQRNVWLSIATTLIMTLTLLMILFLYFINVLGGQILRNIEQKVDLSAVFKTEVGEQQINLLAEDLKARSDVEEVRIVSSEEALEDFRQRHAADPFFEDSLQELEENPLPSTMYIVATDPRYYELIAEHLESEKFAPFLEEINYENTRDVINRLITFMTGLRNAGLITTVVLATLVVLIMFNTIRLAIYSFREEIDIMRLVGASGWFIRGPFIVEAILVALLSVFISSIVIYPTLDAFAPQIERFFFSGQASPFNVYQYAVQNWISVIGLQLVAAVTLAVFSSWIAVRRYLR